MMDSGKPPADAAVTFVRLSPFKETPDFYRTTTKLEGHKRWFEKSRVSVVSRDSNAITLSMPRAYADTRQGIASLIIDEQAPDQPSPPAETAEGKSGSGSTIPERLDIQMGPAGRIVIPVVFRDAMQVEEGGRLMARVEDGELRLSTPAMAIRRVQKLVRETIPGNDSLVDTLLENRRQEVADEFGDG